VSDSSKVNVLVILANPKGTSPLRLGAEDRAIRQSIRLSRYRDNISLTIIHAATVHDLRRALLDQEFHIVHISGHGGEDGLILEDDLGQRYTVPPQALADLFRAYSPPIRCVILNACYSIAQGQLTSLGVPYTIAMEGPISDEAAIEFARGFYDALGAGRDIEFAYEEGCRTVKLAAPNTQFVSKILKAKTLIQEKNKDWPRLAHFGTSASAIRSMLAPLPIPPRFAHAQPSEMHWANRERELESLTKFWHNEQIRVVGLIGWGGVGKSTLARRWYDEIYKQDVVPDGFFWWSFYYQASLDEFLETALTYLTDGKFKPSEVLSPWVRAQHFISLLSCGKFIIVLDGLEVMQKAAETDDDFGRLEDRAFRSLLEMCVDPGLHRSFILVTSRFPLTDLKPFEDFSYREMRVDCFSGQDGAEYLKRRGVKGNTRDLCSLSNEYGGHALSLSLLAGYLTEYFDGQSQHAEKIPFLATQEDTRVNQILQAYNSRLADSQKAFMQLLSAFRRPAAHDIIEAIIHQEGIAKHNLFATLSRLNSFELRRLAKNLEKRGLISSEQDYSGKWCYTTHPIIREYFYQQLSLDPDLKVEVNLRLRDFASKLSVPENPQRLEDLMPLLDVIFYSCRAGLFDEAVQIYHDRMSLGHWELGFRFGAYEFQISFLREFFPDRDLSRPPQVTDPKAKPFLFSEIAYCLGKLGRTDEAATFYKRAAVTALQATDYKSAAIAYQGLAGCAATLTQSQEIASEGLRYAKLANARLWECNLLATLGWVSFLKGEFETAEAVYQEANSLKWSDNPEELGLFSILGVQYATFLLATGRIVQSRENTERNLMICQKRNWRESVAYCKRLLGDIALAEGDPLEAKKHFIEALEIARNFGIQEELCRILLGMAKISVFKGNLEEASGNLAAALDMASRSGYALIEIDIHNAWAEQCLSQGDLEKAIEHARRSLEMSEITGYKWGQGKALHILGQVAFVSGNKSEAQRLLEDSYAIRQQIHDPYAYLTRELLEQL